MVNSPLPQDIAGECQKVAKILKKFVDPTDEKGLPTDQFIPTNILSKAGFVWSGRAGSGLVIARLQDNTWSAPSAIATGGVGFGGQIGAEVTDFVVVLNSEEAVRAFSRGGNVTLGGNLSVAAGPIGRNAEADVSIVNTAPVFSYSKTKGLFAGISIEGSVLIERKDANEKFYKRKISAKDILSGQVPPPYEAQMLYSTIEGRIANEKTAPSTSKPAPPLMPKPNRTSGTVKPPVQGKPNIQAYNTSVQEEKPPVLRKPSVQEEKPPVLRKPSVQEKSPVQEVFIEQRFPVPEVPMEEKPASPTYVSASHSFHEEKPSTFTNPASYNQNTVSSAHEQSSVMPMAEKSSMYNETATALFDFTGVQDGDLAFKAGDTFTITRRTASQNDWWNGEHNGKSGAFPANYVRLNE